MAKLTKRDRRILLELLGDPLFAEDVEGLGKGTIKKLLSAGYIEGTVCRSMFLLDSNYPI